VKKSVGEERSFALLRIMRGKGKEKYLSDGGESPLLLSLRGTRKVLKKRRKGKRADLYLRGKRRGERGGE